MSLHLFFLYYDYLGCWINAYVSEDNELAFGRVQQGMAPQGSWNFYSLVIPNITENLTQVLKVDFVTSCSPPPTVLLRQDVYPTFADIKVGLPEGFSAQYNHSDIVLVGMPENAPFVRGEVWRVAVYQNASDTDGFFNHCFYTI